MPRGLRKLRLAFEEPFLTHFAGIALIHAFCQALGLRRLLQRTLRPMPRYRDFHPADMVLALLYAMIAGMDRVNATQILQYNGAFQHIVGLRRFPDQSALRRFLQRLRPRTVRQLVQLHDRLRAGLFALPRPRSSLVFDLDSVVLVVYGHAERARVGYNPKKRGRRSYHPLLCFEAHRQEFWHGSLRPGNTVAATGAVPFLQVCLAKVPPRLARSRLRVRGDSGLFGKRIGAFLDEARVGYAIVAKGRGPIKDRARECRFRRLATGWEVGEFRYQPTRWTHPHRFVVVRRPIPTDPVEAKQLTLFKDRQYAYHVLVTNLRTHPWRVWRFYAQRARIEKHIRELLVRLPAGQGPHGGLGGQRRLLPTVAVRLRPHPLFPPALLAARVSDEDPQDAPDGTPGHPGPVGDHRPSSALEAPARLPLRKDLPVRDAEDPATEADRHRPILQGHGSEFASGKALKLAK